MINNLFSKNLKHDDILRWLAFALIALAVLLVYFPSLYYPPRADQVIYLAETANQVHPTDLILGDYDHNRHRTFAPGDELLFRPLLYAILGSEQVLFAHHFWAWQLLGIVAHLGLVWVMLRLLWQLSGAWFAIAGTSLFALTVVNYEMVTWTHLSSYLLMMTCMLAALEQMILCFKEAKASRGRIYRMLFYFLIACFVYETANIFACWITLALLFTFPKDRARLLVLFIPVILYALTSFLNFLMVAPSIHHASGQLPHISLLKFLAVTIQLSCWWAYEGLFNGLYHYFLAIRTMFQTGEVLVFKPLIINNVQVFLSLIILSMYAILVWINRRLFLERMKVLIILAAILFSYTAVIVAGRDQEMGSLIETVRVNSYFPYIFWAILVIMAFALISSTAIKKHWQQWLMIIFTSACLLQGVWQAKEIYHMTTGYSRGTNNSLLLITTLDMLIQEKAQEPNFSFYVDSNYPGNYPYGTMRKITDKSDKVYSFAELLYPQYFKPKEAAKYKLLLGVQESSTSSS